MLVSVIVPVYNASEYLSRTLSAIRNLDYPEVELIVVDDGVDPCFFYHGFSCRGQCQAL